MSRCVLSQVVALPRCTKAVSQYCPRKASRNSAQAAWAAVPGTRGPISTCFFTREYAESPLNEAFTSTAVSEAADAALPAGEEQDASAIMAAMK